MLTQQAQEVERKVIAILRILRQSGEPIGARVISHHLSSQGIHLTERAVRYHLKILDERGFTENTGRDGRLITRLGLEELDSALVSDKVGSVAAKIELLACQAEFDVERCQGTVPVNISFFPEKQFERATEAMRRVFRAGICVSNLVAVSKPGQELGGINTPRGRMGLATVCSVVINGALLRAGIPVDYKYSGVLQIRDRRPLRFVELIQYSGSSLDPAELYIASRMTSVGQAARRGEGRILANFREIPAVCQPAAEKVIGRLREAGLGGLLVMGEVSRAVCGVPVELNKVGMILAGGLNPVAAAVESGVDAESHSMSALMDYRDLTTFSDI